MRLKRFLALAVAMIMALAMVPAMTVSAAGTTTTIEALGGDVLWACPDGSFNDTAIASAFSGWTSTAIDGANVNMKTYTPGNTMQFYTNGNVACDATVTSPGYGDGADMIVIEWTMKRQNPSDLYFDFSFKDINGTEIAFVKFDRNYTTVSGEYYMGYPADGTDCAIVAYNNADGSTHTVDYYVNGAVVSTVSDKAGVINGFKSITSSNGRWSKAWQHIGFANLAIGSVTLSETSVEVAAEYVANGSVVHTESGRYDTAEGETGVTFPAYAYSANGSNVMYGTDGATLSENGQIAMDVVANGGTHTVGDVVAVSGTQYEIKSANLVPNGDFAYGTAGWYNAAGGAAGFFNANGDGTMTLTAGGTGAGGASSLYRAWATEAGKKYLFTFDADSANIYDKVSVKSDISATADGTVILDGASAGTNVVVFDATEAFVQVNFRWLGTGNTFGNFGLYEIEEATVTVAEEIASVEEVADITVIGDTAVVLPATLSVTGSLGSEVTGTVVWGEVTEGVATGTVTAQFGEAEPVSTTVTANVVVLPETFTLNDFASVNGQTAAKDGQIMFPVAIADEFAVEFVATYASFGDLFITLKTADAGFFGPEQIALGANGSGAFRPVNGNGSGGRATADADKAQLVAGTVYRFLVQTNPATHKYSVTVYDATTGALVADVKDFGYRTNADAIECITALTNNGAGSIAVSNVKVSAPSLVATDYTVVFVINGEAQAPTTVSAFSADHALSKVVIPSGYDVQTAVEGTEIVITLTSTFEASVSFVNANEEVVYTASQVVANGESFTVDAKEVFVLDDGFVGTLYEIPETVVNETGMVVEVAPVANKYVALEDALVSDNEIWGIKATNSNSVFVAAGADANRAPLADANGANNHDANHTPSTLGKSRVGFFQFPVIDVTEGQKVTAVFPVRDWHGNGFSNGNQTLRFSLTAVNDDSWTLLTDGGTYDSVNVPVFEGWNTVVFSNVAYNGDANLTFDVTEVMAAAKSAGLSTITFRLNAPFGAAYIAEREAAVAGGAYEGRVSYMTVEDANLVKVEASGAATLTKNGSAMNGFAYVAANDDVRLNAADAIVVSTDAGYVLANKTMSITAPAVFANTVPAGLGLAMVDGAQVRIGATEIAEGGKLDAMADSGIRFLATANYTDTVLADDAVEFGIKVTAEGSTNVLYVPAVNFQDADNTVFTAAITKLAEKNYNRKYTATAYAKVPMADDTVEEFTAGEVTRSIYQVSAGIMKNGNAGEDAPYVVEGTVKNILNAYINQVGIRLGWNGADMAVEAGKYTGDVFFAVTQEAIDGGVRVTITPDTTWGTPVEIAQWWNEYVRVNNNNSVAATYMSNATFNEGALTFDFVVPAGE